MNNKMSQLFTEGIKNPIKDTKYYGGLQKKVDLRFTKVLINIKALQIGLKNKDLDRTVFFIT